MICINIVKIKRNDFGGFMERDLFHILQNLKININTLDLDYLEDRLIVLSHDCNHEERNFEYYRKRYIINNLKYSLIKVLMLGRCTKNQRDKYEYIIANLEENLDKIAEKYSLLFSEFVVTEVLLETNKNKKEFLDNNFKQIDSFFEFIDKFDSDEKEKIFSYKMGVKNA